HRSDGGHPARDGTDLDVQVVPGDRAGGCRELPGSTAGGPAAGSRRAARVTPSHHPTLGSGRLRAVGAGVARAPHRAPRGATNVRVGERGFLGLLAVALVALSFYPLWGSGYGVRSMLQLFMWIALAGSWNIISGLTGYVSFGHVAFFGAGAYA